MKISPSAPSSDRPDKPDELKVWLQRLPRPGRPAHWVAVALLAMLLLIPAVPPLIAEIIKYAASEQGYQMSYRQADISPIDGEAVYHDLVVKVEGTTLFTARQLSLDLDIWAALDETYIIRDALIDSAFLDISVIPEQRAATDQPPPHWQIKKLLIRQLNLTALPRPSPQDITLHQLEIQGLDSHATQAGTFLVDLGFDQTRLKFSSQVVMAPEPDIDQVNIQLSHLDLGRLPAEYLPESTELTGITDIKARMHWAKTDPNRAGRTLQINDLTISLQDTVSRVDGLIAEIGQGSIQGQARVRMDEAYAPRAIHYQGEIRVQGEFSNDKGQAPRIDQLDSTMDVELNYDLITRQGDIQTKGNVNLVGWSQQLAQGDVINGNLNWKGKTSNTLDLATGDIDSSLEGLFSMDASLNDTTDAQTRVKLPRITADQLVFSGTGHIRLTAEQAADIQVQGDLSLKQLTAGQITDHPDLVARLNDIQVTEAEFHSSPQQLNIRQLLIDTVRLEGEASEDSLPIDRIRLDQLAYNQQKLWINTLDIGRISAQLRRASDGVFAVQPSGLLPQPTEKTSAKEVRRDKPELAIRIGTILLGKDSRIEIRDETVRPSFKTGLELDTTEVKNLLIPSTNTPATIHSSGKLGDRGVFNLDGEIALLGDGIKLAASSKLTGLSIAQYNQYAKSQIGYGMHKGHMDLDIDITIDKRQLDGKTRLLITGLKVEPTNSEAQKRFDKSLSLSLTAALGLLEDKKGHIDLELPISGDTDNPNLGLGDIIGKALGKGIKAGMLLSLQPLGLAVLALDAIANAGGIPLGEIEFETGSALLNSIAAERLSLLADKMEERPGIKLKVCAIALATELPAMAKLTKSKQATEGQSPDNDQPPRKKEAVIDPVFTAGLAQDRLDAIIGFLTENKVSPDRLIDCEPKVVPEKEGKPSALLIIPDTQ